MLSLPSNSFFGPNILDNNCLDNILDVRMVQCSVPLINFANDLNTVWWTKKFLKLFFN